MAALTLQQMGFKDVYSLAGGFARWQQEGAPVVAEARYV
jgi:rhodanese-related sulfurtransferase